MNLDQALQTYVAESRELLDEMEDGLLRLENADEADRQDILNAIFRAAHTIKGSAGLFGLDGIVDFTHGVESVLDLMREGKLAVSEALLALLLPCADHMRHLIDTIVTGEALGTDATARGEEFSRQLARYYESGGTSAQAGEPASAGPAGKTQFPRDIEHDVESEGGGPVETDNWHISLRFGREVLRNGMDPLSFLRYLGTLGEVVMINTLFSPPVSAEEMDPEACYLGFEISFRSEADKAAIEGVFEFVREDCEIHILPPHSKVGDYVKLIEAMPNQEQKLGEILVQCGTLTQAELEHALGHQAEAVAGGNDAPPLGKILVEDRMVTPQVVEAALGKQQKISEAKAQEARSIRVDADKLDALITLVGELVIAGASASLMAQKSGDGDLMEAMSNMARLVEEVRDSSLNLRMVQIGATFNKFQRVVRDVSKELGKDIELVISGADTELDKTVVEKIGDPLMHLVRNSMDHGIERAEARRERGKPERGTLRLNAFHDSGSIVIEVSDDGGGLNRDKILAKAVERGLVQSGDGMSDKEIYQLIFEPGFSTADQVTNLSGRGVGMDVVRRNITALRGTIDIDSQAGLGTTMRIRLPLTLAIIDGFLVGVGRASFVVPLDLVIECVELSETIQGGSGDRNYLNLRGEVLPFLRLRETFEITDERISRRENVVVVQYGGHKAGLVVDQLLGEFQTVIKPLGRMFSHIRSIGGSTILGNGEVALILDVPNLVQHVIRDEDKLLS